MDWDDLRVFDAVAERGGLAAGARAVGLAENTVRRRLQALSAMCGLPLFRRTHGGLALTPVGERLAAVARSMATKATIRTTGASDKEPVSGIVRILMGSRVHPGWIIPVLTRLRREHRGVSIDLVTETPMARRAIASDDIIVSTDPTLPSLLGGSVAARMPVGLFAHRDYISRAGAPSRAEDLRRFSLISSIDGLVVLDGQGPMGLAIAPAEVDFLSANAATRDAALRAGAGIGRGLVAVMTPEPDLVRVLPALTEMVEVWTATTADDAASGIVRTVLAAIDRHLADLDVADRPLNPAGEG